MTSTFDTILKSGTVVNQDGEGLRDIGIAAGNGKGVIYRNG